MNAYHQTEQLILEYLERVVEQLQDLPPGERAEIRSDLRAHIDEAIGDRGTATEADVRNVLERLGTPQDVAQSARDRAAEPVRTSEPQKQEVQRRLNGTPGALEVAAIILTVLFWPIGILLSWVSERWLTRDKIIATIIPVIGTFLLAVTVVGGMAAWGYGATTTVSRVVDQVQPAQPVPPAEPGVRSPQRISEQHGPVGAVSRIVLVLALLVGFIAAPFVAGVYLAIRLQPVEELIDTAGRRIERGYPASGHA